MAPKRRVSASKVQRDGRLRALAAFIEAYEAEHGLISGKEIEVARARAKTHATRVARKGASNSRQ
jgi:hypothetical protein